MCVFCAVCAILQVWLYFLLKSFSCSFPSAQLNILCLDEVQFAISPYQFYWGNWPTYFFFPPAFEPLIVYQRIKVELSNDELGLLHQLHDKRICLLTTQARLLKVLILMINVFRLPFHHNHNKSVKLNQQFSAESVQIYESSRQKKRIHISTRKVHIPIALHAFIVIRLSLYARNWIYMWINCRWCHSIDAIEIVLCFTYIAIAIASISHTVYSLFFICCILIYKRIDITIKLYSSGCNNNSSLSHVHSVVERVPHLCTPCFNRNVSTSRIRKKEK